MNIYLSYNDIAPLNFIYKIVKYLLKQPNPNKILIKF